MITNGLDASKTDAPMDDEGFQEVLGHGRWPKNTERMNALIEAEGEDSDDQPLHRHGHCHSRRVPRKHATRVDNNNFFSSLPVDEALDVDDNDFIGESSSESSSESFSSGSDSDIKEISNEEVSHI